MNLVIPDRDGAAMLDKLHHSIRFAHAYGRVIEGVRISHVSGIHVLPGTPGTLFAVPIIWDFTIPKNDFVLVTWPRKSLNVQPAVAVSGA